MTCRESPLISFKHAFESNTTLNHRHGMTFLIDMDIHDAYGNTADPDHNKVTAME